MDNAAEAIKMAGSVLMFVIGLSVAILSYSQVRETADIILDYRDRETVYIDGGFYYETKGTERIVGLETVVPAIYRAYLENYKIVFKGEGLENKPIYTIKNSGLEKYELDLENDKTNGIENIPFLDNADKAEFLSGILYGNYKINKENFESHFGVIVPDEPLYNRLKNKTITEYLGVYYQDDKQDVPNINKTEKRIITYKVQ